MLYDVASPEEYLDTLDHDWRRETLERLRALIQTSAPEIEERMNYKMLAYGLGDDNVFHLNAQKAHVALYVGDIAKIDPDGSLLDGLSTGKGCIRFTKSKTVSETRIDTFIAKAVELWRQGQDTDC